MTTLAESSQSRKAAPSALEDGAGPPDDASLRRVYLLPGRLVFTSEPTLVSTVLGSCVSVCLWDDAAGVGGVNHYQLPSGEGIGLQTGRFAPSAMTALMESLLEMGASRRRLRAKVFGGARVLAAKGETGADLGARNAQVAVEWLSEQGIAVTSSDLGGSRGRKLVFRTDDGSAWVKRL